MSRKRLIVALLLLPATMLFAALHKLVEWWHFELSYAVLRVFRRAEKRRDTFFASLDRAPDPHPQPANTK